MSNQIEKAGGMGQRTKCLRFGVGDKVFCDYMLKYNCPQEGVIEEIRPKMGGYHVRHGSWLYFHSDENLEPAK